MAITIKLTEAQALALLNFKTHASPGANSRRRKHSGKARFAKGSWIRIAYVGHAYLLYCTHRGDARPCSSLHWGCQGLRLLGGFDPVLCFSD